MENLERGSQGCDGHQVPRDGVPRRGASWLCPKMHGAYGPRPKEETDAVVASLTSAERLFVVMNRSMVPAY